MTTLAPPMALAPRPVALSVSMDAIPAELKALRRWVMWRYTFVGGRWTKVPYVARRADKQKASVSDPSTWSSFSAARACYEAGGFDGVGMVLCLDDGFVGVDLDHCIDPQSGEVAQWAVDLIRKMPGYWECSPSGTGLRHIRRGKLPPNTPRRSGQVEMYDTGRFLTITGFTLEGFINGAI